MPVCCDSWDPDVGFGSDPVGHLWLTGSSDASLGQLSFLGIRSLVSGAI